MTGYKTEFIIALNKMKDNLLQYKDEADIWTKPGGTNNTPANLALHVCGNLKHNIGAEIGKTGYIRNRDLEFTLAYLSRDEVIAEIDSTIEMIEPILDNLKPEDVNKPFPGNIHGEGETIGSVLTKIALHLGYHFGQVNYHRRILNPNK